jgi:hypothetical protein
MHGLTDNQKYIYKTRSLPLPDTHPTNILNITQEALNWAHRADYRGYSKFDVLNSPIIYTLTKYSSFLRKAFTFVNSRMPINIRPLLLVQKKQNPKGLALFARSYLNLFTLTNAQHDLSRGEALLNTLVEISQKESYSGHCWGYEHPWQNIAFYIPPYEPNCVVTCAVADAFLQAYQITKNDKYLEILNSIAQFILNDLTNIPVGNDMRCCSYDLHSNWKVINVNAFASAFLAKVYAITQNEQYKTPAHEMMRWVISQKTDYHAWYYTDPPKASRITHDNYHTGFVLDAICEYLNVFPNEEYQIAIDDGLQFYKENLFEDNFAPKWMHDISQPHDIHGCAQGVITFSRFGKHDQGHLKTAQQILSWCLDNLFDKKVCRFYYQKTNKWTKSFTLMRWSQAWMCFAMSEYLIGHRATEGDHVA